MIYLVLGVTTITALIGYIKWKISALAVTYYMETNGIKMSDADMQHCTSYCVKRLFHLP